MKRFAIPFLLFLSSTAVHAQDVTKQFIDYLDHHFVGSRSAADRTWDNTYCLAPNPFGGCSQTGGSKIYASASGTVDAKIDQFGNGWYIDTQTNPWTGIKVVSHWADLQVTYSYSGYSEGKKQCYPGNFFCGMEWDSLHPTGRIVVYFKADGQKFSITMEYEVQQGHGDKPNAVLRAAMYNLRETMRQRATDFVRLIGSEAIIEVK